MRPTSALCVWVGGWTGGGMGGWVGVGGACGVSVCVYGCCGRVGVESVGLCGCVRVCVCARGCVGVWVCGPTVGAHCSYGRACGCVCTCRCVCVCLSLRYRCGGACLPLATTSTWPPERGSRAWPVLQVGYGCCHYNKRAFLHGHSELASCQKRKCQETRHACQTSILCATLATHVLFSGATPIHALQSSRSILHSSKPRTSTTIHHRPLPLHDRFATSLPGITCQCN